MQLGRARELVQRLAAESEAPADLRRPACHVVRVVAEPVRALCRYAGTLFDVRVVKGFVADILGDGAAGRAATGVLA